MYICICVYIYMHIFSMYNAMSCHVIFIICIAHNFFIALEKVELRQFSVITRNIMFISKEYTKI